MSDMADWESRCMEHHRGQVAQGLHDAECEYGRKLKRSILMLCNCSKRRREAVGFTTPPSDDLEFPPPTCTHCDRELDHDGDTWNCGPCSLAWDSRGDGSSCWFTDDFGDLAGSEHA